MPRTFRLPLPTDAWVRAILPLALIFIATACDRNYQTDLWHHLARGRAIAEEGRLVDADRFTYTVAGRRMQDANWGWQVLFYHVYRLGGLPLVQVVNSLTLTLTLGVLLGLAWRRSGSMLVASGVCVFTFFGLWQLLLIRPQTFSLLLFVVLYAVLEGACRQRWLLALPPLLLALWVNLHGGFPMGLALVGCYALAAFLGERAEWPAFRASALVRRGCPWALCLGASAVATLLNPYGWRVYEYVGLTSSTAPARRIDEWLPAGLNLLAGKVWVASLLAMLVLFAVSRRRPSVRQLCLVVVFLPPACGSVRMVAWWLLVSAPILAAQVRGLGWFAAPTPVRPSPVAGVVCGLLLLGMVLSLPWLESLNPMMRLPGRAHRTESDLQVVADHLAREGRGRLFTRFAWGEYLAWAMAPRATVFMDGRIEIYPDDVWAQYGAVTRGRADWEEVLAGYGVDCLLLDTTGYHRDLLPLVERSPCWRRCLQQGDAVLYVRDAGELTRVLPQPAECPGPRTQ
jgi:hypothetical protein